MRGLLIAVALTLPVIACSEAADDAVEEQAEAIEEGSPDLEPGDPGEGEEVLTPWERAARDLERQIAEIERGMGRLDVPSAMERDTQYLVTLTISSDAEVVASFEEEEAAGPSNQVTFIEPVVGRCMQIKLAGTGFDIEPRDEAVRDLGASRTETWRWDVTPEREGLLELQVETRVLQYADGECGVPLRNLPPERYNVTVTVGFWARVQDAIDRIGLLNTLLGALAALFAALLALSRDFRTFLRGLFGRTKE